MSTDPVGKFVAMMDTILALESLEWLAIDSDQFGTFLIYPDPSGGCGAIFEAIEGEQ